MFVAVAVYVPNQEVGFWLVRTFTVKMKWLAVAFVAIDLLSIPASNAGGHIAHLGGALFGFLFVVSMRYLAERKIGGGTGRTRIKIHKKKRSSQGGTRPLSDDEYNRRRADEQKRIDAILDKISKSGYQNLTKEEKETLFKFKG